MTEHADIDSPVVNRVWPLATPDEAGHECAVCSEEVAADACWRVTLSGTGVVLTCGRCADHARRHGHLHIDEDPDGDGDGSDRPRLTIGADVLHEVEGDLVEGNAHVFDSPGSYAAGVRDAVEQITLRGED